MTEQLIHTHTHTHTHTCVLHTKYWEKSLLVFLIFCKFLCDMKSPFPVASHHLNTERDSERLHCDCEGGGKGQEPKNTAGKGMEVDFP